MILNIFASIILASFALNALADEFGSSALKVLNEANFNSFLENHEVAFIKFYAPWYLKLIYILTPSPLKLV